MTVRYLGKGTLWVDGQFWGEASNFTVEFPGEDLGAGHWLAVTNDAAMAQELMKARTVTVDELRGTLTFSEEFDGKAIRVEYPYSPPMRPRKTAQWKQRRYGVKP